MSDLQATITVENQRADIVTRYLWILDGDVLGVGLTADGARDAAAKFMAKLFEGELHDVAEVDVDTWGFAVVVAVIAPQGLGGAGWRALLQDLEEGAGVEPGVELVERPQP